MGPFDLGTLATPASRMRSGDNGDRCHDSGFGYRRGERVGDVVSLGSTTVILAVVCFFTLLAGLILGLFVAS
jgi:hypothetical protein